MTITRCINKKVQESFSDVYRINSNILSLLFFLCLNIFYLNITIYFSHIIIHLHKIDMFNQEVCNIYKSIISFVFYFLINNYAFQYEVRLTYVHRNHVV